MKRPFETYILLFFLFLLSINALYGGGSMIISPDGSLLGMKPEWLGNSPFHNFLIPGILLLAFLGVFPAIALAGLIRKKGSRRLNVLNIYKDKHWSWSFSIYTGIITVIWIVIQQLMAEYFILQTFICLAGILIVILTLMPRVQKFYSQAK